MLRLAHGSPGGGQLRFRLRAAELPNLGAGYVVAHDHHDAVAHVGPLPWTSDDPLVCAKVSVTTTPVVLNYVGDNSPITLTSAITTVPMITSATVPSRSRFAPGSPAGMAGMKT